MLCVQQLREDWGRFLDKRVLGCRLHPPKITPAAGRQVRDTAGGSEAELVQLGGGESGSLRRGTDRCLGSGSGQLRSGEDLEVRRGKRNSCVRGAAARRSPVCVEQSGHRAGRRWRRPVGQVVNGPGSAGSRGQRSEGTLQGRMAPCRAEGC